MQQVGDRMKKNYNISLKLLRKNKEWKSYESVSVNDNLMLNINE